MPNLEEKVIDRLWEEYRDKNIKPGHDPENLKTIANIFYSGMFAMFKEIFEINMEVAETFKKEFQETIEEINNENQRGSSAT